MFARLAIEADEDAVVGLARMQVEETLPHLTFVEAITRATFARSMATADPTIFVADHRGAVVGYLMALLSSYAFTDGLFAAQEVIYVRPDKRGTRAAALLIREFTRWAERLGAREIMFGISNKFQPDRTAQLIERLTGAERVGLYLKRVGAHGEGRQGR